MSNKVVTIDKATSLLQFVAMIKDFVCKETEKVYLQQHAKPKVIPDTLQNRLLELLQILDAANELTDLYFPPSNKLKKIQGKRNEYELRVNQKYRLYFTWKDGYATDV